MWKLASPKERARVAEEYRKELAMKKEAKPAAADVAATAVCVQPNHAVHGQGGTVTKLPSPAAVASAIPEMLAPAMPVTVNEKGKTVHEHRACVTAVIEEHIEDNREDLVNALLMTAAVARLIPRSEVANTPEAKKALDVEWEKLRSKGTWDESRVKECKTVIAEAKAKGEKAHIARIFEACYLKGSELAVGDPSRKYKGRTVFEGNRVVDENYEQAMFAELGSSPASMEAGKIVDLYGSQPGFGKQQGDAKQAYTQALFEGITTWVRLRTEDYWEHFPEEKIWVRHHLYPRRKRYAPENFEGLLDLRVTCVAKGNTYEYLEDSWKAQADVKEKNWWTGCTVFSYADQVGGHAAAAAMRNNTAAKKQSKKSKFKELIDMDHPKDGCMKKPVNIVHYDMGRFLGFMR